MTINKEELNAQLKELEAEFNKRTTEIQKLLDEPDIELWKPKESNYWTQISERELIFGNRSMSLVLIRKMHGYKTIKQAGKAAELIAEYNNQIAFFMEHCPDYEPDWSDNNEAKYFIAYNYNTNKFQIECNRFIHHDCAVYFPRNTADLYCEMRNSGALIL